MKKIQFNLIEMFFMKLTNKFNKTRLVFLTVLTVVMMSCTHETDVSAIKDKICFNTQVMPIIKTNCSMKGSGCHDQSGTNTERINLKDYAAV